MAGNHCAENSSARTSYCAHCSQPATLICDRCAKAPQYRSEVPDTYYCSKECREANKGDHQALCDVLHQRIRVQQAACILQKTWLLFREEAWDNDIRWVQHYGNKVFLHEGEHVSLRRFRTLKRCPENISGATGARRSAVLMALSCTNAAITLPMLVEVLCAGLEAKAAEVVVEMKETPLTVCFVSPDRMVDSLPYLHEVLKISLPNGEVWCIDMTGAQYGLARPLFPWRMYQRAYVSCQKCHDDLGAARSESERRIALHSYHDLDMQWEELSDAFEGMLGEAIEALRGWLDGALVGDGEFEAAVANFLEGLRQRIRDCVLLLGEDERQLQREKRWKEKRGVKF